MDWVRVEGGNLTPSGEPGQVGEGGELGSEPGEVGEGAGS